MADEPEPGRLAIWSVQSVHQTVRLHVDLGFDWTTLAIGPDGQATTTLSDSFAAWIAASAQEVRP